MDSTRHLTCIVCPMGCKLDIDMSGDDMVITGNGCKLGEKYAIDEITNPTRMVTSSIRAIGGDLPLVSVKTKTAIPKDKIPQALEQIKAARYHAPVRVGDVIVANVAGTDIDIVATRNVEAV